MNSPAKRSVLYSGQSPYGKYKVVDMNYNGRPARVLFGDGRSPQSGAALDDEPELLFNYNQRLLEIIMSKQPKRVLIIGGGAFMLPIALYHRFPRLIIDVVEIDQLLVKLGRDFFSLPSDPRLSVFVDDGARFIQKTKNKYDAIIIDAFSGYTIPPHLVESFAVRHYKKRLSRGGVVAINFIAEYKPQRPSLSHELIATFRELFKFVSLYQADSDCRPGDEQNYVLVAGSRSHHFDYLQSIDVIRPVER